MKLLNIILTITGLIGLNATSAYAQNASNDSTAISLPACDITDIKSLYWDAIGQDVTLTTYLKGEAERPSAKLSLKLANGTNIDLGTGSGYIVDFDRNNPPSCEDHLKVATSGLIESFGPPIEGSINDWEMRTLDELNALKIKAEDCLEINDKSLKPRYCDHLEYTRERIITALSGDEWPEGRFHSLVAQKAPLLNITRSTYYDELVVYDPISNKIRVVLEGHC